jgi:hypothetical protein
MDFLDFIGNIISLFSSSIRMSWSQRFCTKILYGHLGTKCMQGMKLKKAFFERNRNECTDQTDYSSLEICNLVSKVEE